MFTLLRDERAIFPHWERLVTEHEVKGRAAHDARIVASIHRHGVTRILTFNVADFARYPGIVVLAPQSVKG